MKAIELSHITIRYQQATVDGSKIFYREAGPKSAPTILLLHGFPTSSHMFRNLIPALADRYHQRVTRKRVCIALLSRRSVN
jgi:pimeloyl-ACP methyl ester carboxylesterase